MFVKIYKIVSTVCTVLAVIFILALFASNILFGIKPYIVVSGSMEPAIHTGSVCFVNSDAEYSDVEVGDVVSYEVETGSLVTHRVIEQTSEGLITKGDNNETDDGVSVTSENFRGITLFSIPCLGFIAGFVKTKRGLIVVITAVLCLIILDYIICPPKKKN